MSPWAMDFSPPLTTGVGSYPAEEITQLKHLLVKCKVINDETIYSRMRVPPFMD